MPVPRVLIAAGEEAVRKVLPAMLRDDGCEVLVVASTADAIAQAPQFCPDTLIIETIMPGIDGVRAAIRITQETKCQVLFLEAPLDILSDYGNALRREVPDCHFLPPCEKDETLAIVHGRITGRSVAEKSQTRASITDATKPRVRTL